MLRHRGYEMWLDESDGTPLYKKDSSFTIVPSLAGKGVSFQSLNYPDRYLRHRGGKCYIEVNDGTQPFKEDASFIMHMGLASTQSNFSKSFESVNSPGFYIRHSRFRVQISKFSNTDIYKKDASWVLLGDDSENGMYLDF